MKADKSGDFYDMYYFTLNLDDKTYNFTLKGTSNSGDPSWTFNTGTVPDDLWEKDEFLDKLRTLFSGPDDILNDFIMDHLVMEHYGRLFHLYSKEDPKEETCPENTVVEKVDETPKEIDENDSLWASLACE